MTASARVRRRILTGHIPIRFVGDGEEGVGQLRNISKAGLFIRSDDMPRPGCPLALQFESPYGHMINLRGEVRWRTRDLVTAPLPAGFGVLIHEPPAPYRDFFLWAASQTEKEDEPA